MFGKLRGGIFQPLEFPIMTNRNRKPGKARRPGISCTRPAPRFAARSRDLFRFAIRAVRVGLCFCAVASRAEPLATSWVTVEGAKYARIYKTQADALAGNSVSNWIPSGRVTGGGQTNPAYAGVQSIRVSTNFVYVQSSALARHVMGPWYFDAGKTDIFVNWPSKQDMLARFPRTPTSTVAKTKTALGAIALWVDGTIIHNQLDAFYWNGTNDANSASVFTRSWQRNARAAEGPTFDPSGSHQPYTGERHHHISPSGLRYELGDHMNYNPANHTYTENPASSNHSPVVGWSFDGYPIYGPYGFSDPTNMNSAVARMRTGYVPRDGHFGTTDLNTAGRTNYPAWALAIGKPTTNNGPNVSTNFPIGWYVQDFDHIGDHGYAQGVDYDLDRYNGRFCKTPEFPGGTYAYFIAIDTNGAPAFPYIIGLQYYGVKNGGDLGNPASAGFTNVETNVVVYLGGPNADASMKTPASATSSTLTLTWSGIEGGHYKVESSGDFTTWTNIASDVRVNATNAATAASANGGTKVFRITRTSLEPYDPVNTP